MPSLPTRPRHAAPRNPRSVLLPGTLLAVAGIAFGGLAVMPAAAENGGPRVTAATALDPVALPAPAPTTPAPTTLPPPEQANVTLGATLAQGLAVAASPRPVPSPSARPTERASRSRAGTAAVARPAFVRPGVGRLTSGFGRRWGRLHAGIDLASGIGSPVRAVTDATVIAAGNQGGYGRAVRLEHQDGTVSVYAHMSALLVSVGQRVQAGDVIGREGNTGHSTGPHLHFEIRINDVPINPIPWLTARGITV